jgi:hypothetical protein
LVHIIADQKISAIGRKAHCFRQPADLDILELGYFDVSSDGTHVPVEEPSPASIATFCTAENQRDFSPSHHREVGLGSPAQADPNDDYVAIVLRE